MEVSSDSNKSLSVLWPEQPTIQRNKIEMNDGMEFILRVVACIEFINKISQFISKLN